MHLLIFLYFVNIKYVAGPLMLKRGREIVYYFVKWVALLHNNDTVAMVITTNLPLTHTA